MERKNIAGMSLKGGRKDQFFFCLLEFYPDSGRWFLKSLLQVKDEESADGDEAIRNWITDYNLKQLVVDFPISSPPCHNCVLDCPGIESCPVQSVKEVNKRIEKLLVEDSGLYEDNPKEYERSRNKDDEFDMGRDSLAKETHEHLLSKSFKRRLRKGFVPYWNRPLDFWIWKYYYDQLLEFFNISYDSFGNTSLMLLSRFSYLRRHFPRQLELFEGNVPICLIELLRGGVIHKKDILNLSDIEWGAEARLNIIKRIETKLNIFIYEKDLMSIVTNPRAFDSFLLAVVGQRAHLDKARQMPIWSLPDENCFIVPQFES